ncbi:MAG TPA: hypothetical protein VGH28_06305 [Polyangiaceae bacterium]
MRPALFCLALVACAHATVERPRAIAPTAHVNVRAEVAAAPPVPGERRIDLPIVFVLEGKEPSAQHTGGTLIVVRVEQERYWLEELDVATMRAFHSRDLGHESPVDLKAGRDVLYVLANDGETHTLSALDMNGFDEVAVSRVARAVPGRFQDHAVTTGLTVGTRGVLVTYRSQCPKGTPESEDGCVYYETHRLGDLAVVKTRRYAFDRMWDFSRPQIHVPDDCGEIPAGPEEKGPPEASCPFHGTIMLGSARVGDHYFMATSGCCGGPQGGFFECDAPK